MLASDSDVLRDFPSDEWCDHSHLYSGSASGCALFKSPLSSAASVHASGDSTSLDEFNVILFFPWNFGKWP